MAKFTNGVPDIPLAESIEFSDEFDRLIVILVDGRRLHVPLEWFPRLIKATPDDLTNWKLTSGGRGIRWEGLDEDLSVRALLSNREWAEK